MMTFFFSTCRMRRQAERWGAELHQEDVEFIDVKSNPFTVKSGERKVIYCFAAHFYKGVEVFLSK